MRIYEGAARQDFEEVFRSLGSFLDARGMRDVLILEIPDGFVVQGVVTAGASAAGWSEAIGTQTKETVTFLDDDVARFMEEAARRRGSAAEGAAGGAAAPGAHEAALRVIGRWLDERRPRDVFLFEQEGAYVVRIASAGHGGLRHELAEFTRDDIADLVARGPGLRGT